MPYNNNLADRVPEYSSKMEDIDIAEKKIFGGLAFMVNDKMCIKNG